MDASDYEGYYSDRFKQLHTKVTYGSKAPHKAILLLSVIDLIENGVITNCFIPFSQEIDRQFQNLWIRYIGYSEKYRPKSSVPFWHMGHEEFWELILKEGYENSFAELANKRAYGDFSTMSKYVKGAMIDSTLFNILLNPIVRAHFRVTLIQGYL